MTSEASMLLRDAIHIQESVQDSDFVMKIHEGVPAAERTLREYVVTPGIAEKFDDGLRLVHDALRKGRSDGAFVHGSFGAGKSHYMAVMHLLLTGNPTARAKEGLEGVVAKHSEVLGKNLFAVDYHLIGADTLEGALFSGYRAAVAGRHPDAPLPQLQVADRLFADADRLRERMGDEAFFAPLGLDTAVEGAGRPAGAPDPFGDFEAGAATGGPGPVYDRARTAPASDPSRQMVIERLVENWFTGYQAAGAWLDMTSGLQVMTEHAKALGYEGIVLFLDELVLWLAGYLRNSEKISTETSKVAKLVETGAGALAVPVVSFVARQRALKDFLGGGAVGAEQVALDDSFKWWDDRFTKIELPATALPQIINRRLLQPTSDAGREALAAAFGRVRANATAWNHLLTDEAGAHGGDFEKVYPFSPAIVDAMVALSAIMRRERTAIKIMAQLMQRNRDQLTVGDVIPLGDLFDLVVMSGEDPLTEDMRQLFNAARTYYRGKVLPYLMDKHGLTDENEIAGLPRDAPLRRDDRIAKSLLLAALAPGAASLKDMTASRIAALNHGTIVTPFRGKEGNVVKTMAEEWSAQWGGITVGETADPVITLQLSGVDVDALLGYVEQEDTFGARQSLLRDMIVEELGAEESATLTGGPFTLKHVWQGQRREVDLLFGNVRDPHDLNNEAFRAEDGRWRLIVDFPFDHDEHHSPASDEERIFQLHERLTTDTIAWIPHFLTAPKQRDLGKLVQLEYLLTGSRFDQYATSLPVPEREPARRQLAVQRDALRENIRAALRQAYGIDTAATAVEQHTSGGKFATLAAGIEPKRPSAASLRQAACAVLGDALTTRYPTHPTVDRPEDEVRRGELSAVLELARAAVATGEGRIDPVDGSTLSKVRRVVDGYGAGRLQEATYVLNRQYFRWSDEFTRAAAAEPTVARLRAALDGHGMTQHAQDMLILVWAALEDREWFRHGNRLPVPPEIGALAPDMELREPVLPTQDEWETALLRANALFDAGGDEFHLTAAAVQRLARALAARAAGLEDGTRLLVNELDAHRDLLGLDGESARWTSAVRGRELVAELMADKGPVAVVQALAEFSLPDELTALRQSIATASQVGHALRGASWELLAQLPGLDGDEEEEARNRLRTVAWSDQAQNDLVHALRDAERAVTAILVRKPGPEPDLDEEKRRREETERRERQQELDELERRRQDAERRQREAEEAAAAARRAQGETVDLTEVHKIQELAQTLTDALSNPVEGKRLRVTWRWE